MNLAAAKASAEKAAGIVLGSAKLPCRTTATGLLVLAYRLDTQEVLPGVNVSLSGHAVGLVTPVHDPHRNKAMQPRGRVVPHDVASLRARTDAEGVARYVPVDPGAYSVTLVDVATRDTEFLPPASREQQVALDTCPICVIPVEVGARPEIHVQWKHDAADMRDVRVALGDARPFEQPTDGSGLTSWTGLALRPGVHPVSLDLGGGAKYRLFDDADVPLVVPVTLNIPAGRPRFTFRVQRLGQLKLDIQLLQPGGGMAAVAKPKAIVKWPEDGSRKELVLDGGVSEDIPQAQGPDTRLELDSLEVEDDGEPEVFELVEFTS